MERDDGDGVSLNRTDRPSAAAALNARVTARLIQNLKIGATRGHAAGRRHSFEATKRWRGPPLSCRRRTLCRMQNECPTYRDVGEIGTRFCGCAGQWRLDLELLQGYSRDMPGLGYPGRAGHHVGVE